jgi:NitT/TauT family transport system permease protein
MTPSITRGKAASKGKAAAIKLAVAVFWLAVWQAAYLYTSQELLLVSPWKALSRLLELGRTLPFWQSVLSSCGRILSGYLLAVVVGILLAAATSASAVLYHLFSPPMGMIRATPVASFIILALVWMTTGNIPIFISFLMVVPMIWANVYTGIQNTDVRLLEMAQIYRFSPAKKMGTIYIPSVMPYLTAACSTGLGFSWKSGIAAEVIALPRYAIGKQIYNAKIYLETADLFAWTMAVILLSVVIERTAMWALDKLERKIVKGR